MKKEITLFIVLLFTFSLSAQKKNHLPSLDKLQQDTTQSSFLKKYSDTLQVIYKRQLGILDSLNNDSVPERYIETNPRYYRLFVPLAYYYAPVKEAFNPKWKPLGIKEQGYPLDKLFPIDKKAFNETERVNRVVNRALLATYVSHPELVVDWEDNITKKKIFEVTEAEKLKPETSVISLFKPEPMTNNVGKVHVTYQKPNFWYSDGSGSLQFTQNYISSNWYNGGESTNSALMNFKLNANYNDQQKIQFDNTFEAKIGFNTVSSDTIRKYRINTDLLRVSSKLGIRATTRWYYTISGELSSQFFRNYKANTKQAVSAFFAPANFNLSIGMDYKIDKKNLTLSVFISPGAYNMKYVGDKNIDETQYGLKEGSSFLHDIGSKFQSNMKWTIIPSVVWESRLYYFTSYKKVEAEWENTFNFVLNRYLSTKLFFHGRFDDGVTRKGDCSYFQFKELLSFGINYIW
ncbi:DUF3078 domain-containing protein [uncultured Bacteroides sp.]|uniref:DUF3078 domain-containing protein n=1 Tax=uncultured Bacteroides sp. TaxID=162156 RepID=UPI002AABEEE4|nr:DUF3078 domain-containing protein [uncultured Bacteroides sp.]